MPDASDDASGNASDERDAPPALAELRVAVRRAAEQLEQLRGENARLEDENERLRERVATLEADPAAGRDGTALLVGDDPDALRARIDRFIEAIDDQLDAA